MSGCVRDGPFSGLQTPKGSSMRTRLLEVFGHYFWQVLEYRHTLIICSSTF